MMTFVKYYCHCQDFQDCRSCIGSRIRIILKGRKEDNRQSAADCIWKQNKNYNEHEDRKTISKAMKQETGPSFFLLVLSFLFT